MKILNGKISFDDNYLNDFHEFIEENILTVYLFLPGINPETLHLQLDGVNLTVNAYISRYFRHVFKGKKLSISGKLSQLVEQKSFQVESHHGIIKVSFVIQ